MASRKELLDSLKPRYLTKEERIAKKKRKKERLEKKRAAAAAAAAPVVAKEFDKRGQGLIPFDVDGFDEPQVIAPEGKKKKKKRDRPEKSETKDKPSKKGKVPATVAQKISKVISRIDSDAVAEIADKHEKSDRAVSQKLELLGRTYKLTFGGLSSQIKINDKQKVDMLKEFTADQDAIRVTRDPYASHPAITELESMKNSVKLIFKSKTLDHPSDSTRIFVLDDKVFGNDISKVSDEDMQKEFAKQLEVFHEQMDAAIQEYYTEGVAKVEAAWDDILEKSKEKLKEFYDPKIYPDKEQLRERLYVTFEPQPTVLSEEYARLSPKFQQTLKDARLQTYMQGLNMERQAILASALGCILELADRLKAYHRGDQRTVNHTGVLKTVTAITEARNRLFSTGLLDDPKLKSVLDQVDKTLAQYGTDSKTITGALRADPSASKMLRKVMAEAHEGLASHLAASKRRLIGR